MTITPEPDGSISIANQKAIEDRLYQWLDKYSEEKFPSEHRNHLGVSIIGDRCSRKLWYNFRWVKLEKHEPRMKRLLNRGHLEEPKFTELLMWMGFHVRTIDPETKKQYRFSSVSGHYGGSGDSVALLPDLPNFHILIEYKTHNNKSFTKLKTDRLKISKPQHYTQMCCYGKEFKLKYGLYCAINKDNDDIYFEFVELDWNLATLMEKKAAGIIDSQIAPPRISDQPSYFDCKRCHFNDICHNGAAVEINCRSCRNATPIDKGEWRCSIYGEIPLDFIKKGCPQHASING